MLCKTSANVCNARTWYNVQVTNINVNLDRKSGFVKGYAIIEYAEKEEVSKREIW